MDLDQNEREVLFTQVFTKKNATKPERIYNYKPAVLRTGPLLLLLLTTGVFIGLLQYALYRLPHDEGQVATQAQNDLDNTAFEPDLRRNNQSSPSGSLKSVLVARQDLDGASSMIPPVVIMVTSSDFMSTQPATETVTVSPATTNIASTTTRNHDLLQSAARITTVSTRSQAEDSVETIATASIDKSKSQTQSQNAMATAGAVDTSGQVKVLVYAWTPSQTFIGTYLVVLLAVLYRLWLAEILNKLTLIEPFRQLMSTHGSSAEVSFLSFYHKKSSGALLLDLRHGRFLHASASVAFLLGCWLPALGSEAVWIDSGDYCGLQKATDNRNPCPGRIVTSVIVARTMQILLAVIFVVISAVAAQLLFSSTGLSADPSSMATVAGLMQNPGLADDLGEMSFDSATNIAVMKSTLKGRLYGLGYWRNYNGESGYGIFPLHEREPPKEPVEEIEPSQVLAGEDHGYTPVGPTSSSSKAGTRARRSRWMDFLLLLIITATFAVVLAYYLDHSSSGFNLFFSSDAFGPRFILTGAGTIIAKIWSNVELSTMVMAPYLRLTQQPPPTYRALSFKPTIIPFVSTWRALRNGYFAVAIISLTTLLSETLSIFISGVPYSTGEVFTQAVLSVYTSLGILGFMMVIAIVVIWHRKYELRIPLHPDRLAAKMMYMAGSRMLDDFDGGESETVRDKRLALMRKRYEFKSRLREDGTRVWLVDEVGSTRGRHKV